ncbi:hypothetical protein [Faecalibacter bovis]|uniref:DUF2975 domain-containing protein n=1 Tax=Faecalibacter bovis TaxID=2898187 RepID=A0ABX7XBK0_9FLAO|nr:hypothetical protein [Faecalibacter bovis]QTV05277.1 hypothetical protein J9309_10895 [Faecalibacter bovis]
MITIRNILSILIKLIGFIFILISFIYILPGYFHLIFLDDVMYSDEILENPDVNMSTTLVITDIIINIALYFLLIYKTDLVIKLLRIDKSFIDMPINSLDINLQKYTQITLSVAAIVLFVLSIPEIIISTIQHFRVKNEYLSLDSYALIDNIFIGIISVLLIVFNDKISRLLTK